MVVYSIFMLRMFRSLLSLYLKADKKQKAALKVYKGSTNPAAPA